MAIRSRSARVRESALFRCCGCNTTAGILVAASSPGFGLKNSSPNSARFRPWRGQLRFAFEGTGSGSGSVPRHPGAGFGSVSALFIMVQKCLVNCNSTGVMRGKFVAFSGWLYIDIAMPPQRHTVTAGTCTTYYKIVPVPSTTHMYAPAYAICMARICHNPVPWHSPNTSAHALSFEVHYVTCRH